MLKILLKISLYGIAAATLAAPLAATAAPSDLPDYIKKARYHIVLNDGRLGGNGAAVLQAAIDSAQFIALGEMHLTQQVPAFAAAMCTAMAPHGLTAMALEAGPEAVRQANAALRRPDPAAAMAATLHHYPNATAFLDMREEILLTAQCARAGGPGFRLWGLDQEFIGSAGMLLADVAAEPLRPAARTAVAQLQQLEAADARAAAADGNPAKLFLFAAPEAALTDAASAIETGGTRRASALLQSLRDTRAIYLENGRSGSSANRMRGVMLKHNLLVDLQAAGVPIARQRVLLKFGDSHLYRGINDLHQPDFGNFLAELADANGVSALNISVLGVQGTARLFNGYARPPRLAPVNLATDPDEAWLKPLLDAALPGEWTVFDLRALRFHHLTDANPGLDRFVYGYDFLALAPRVTPATPL